MKLSGVFTRFVIYYILSIIVIGQVISYLGINASSGINIAILVGLVMYIGESFAKKNSRYYSKNEQIKVTIGFILIDLIIQSLFVISGTLAAKQPLEVAPLLFAISFTGILHSLVIYFLVKAYRKNLIKRGLISG